MTKHLLLFTSLLFAFNNSFCMKFTVAKKNKEKEEEISFTLEEINSALSIEPIKKSKTSTKKPCWPIQSCCNDGSDDDYDDIKCCSFWKILCGSSCGFQKKIENKWFEGCMFGCTGGCVGGMFLGVAGAVLGIIAKKAIAKNQ